MVEAAREIGSRRRGAGQRMMHNVGVIALAHINRKGGYTAKYLDKILVGSGGRNLVLNAEGTRIRL